MKYVFAICFFATMLRPVGAQPTPTQEFKPLLRELSTEQKLKLLEYLRYQGASLDREITQTYEQLSADKRGKAQQFIAQMKRPEAEKEKERTTVRWERDIATFGEVEEGTIVLDSFVVVNTGATPYVIRDVKASCDCTVLRRPAFPVMPGETATIRVEFDSRSKAGPTRPGIIIYDNSMPNQRNILYLEGKVNPRVKLKDPLEN
jgi:hypothetical protein